MAAICLLLLPCAISSTMRSSLSVSGSVSGSAAAGFRLAAAVLAPGAAADCRPSGGRPAYNVRNCSITLRAIAGDRRDSPRCTARTVSSTSSSEASFSK